MKLNTQRLIERCIDEGVKDALASCKGVCSNDDQLADQIGNYIWLQLDYYFTFEED